MRVTDKPTLHVENAIVADVRLGLDEGGRLVGALVMRNGTGQVLLGPHTLYAFQPLADRKDSGNIAGHWVYRVLQVTGAVGLPSAIGRTVRILHDGTRILAIGHSVADDWFRPEEEFTAITARSAIAPAHTRADEAEIEDGAPIMDSMRIVDEAA
jgi:hypothetical protein